MYKCKFCELEYDKANLIACHIRWCNLNPNRKQPKRKKNPLGVRNFLGRKHSEESKKLMSEKRKKYLAANKGKHTWSRYTNKESAPEQKFRELTEKTNIKLAQWYIPPESTRLFEMDFADPVNKIDFEINGNQHYESLGKLNPYYQARHDYFVSLGWKVIEIHYSLCFKEEELINILKLCYEDFSKAESKIQEIINDRIERKKKIKEKKIEQAKTYKVIWSKRELTQNQINSHVKRRKAIRPTKEELEKLVWEISTVQLAKRYNVSDKAVEKWCRYYGIKKPPRGYWAKVQFNKI